jgi:hypothetical protein
VSLLDLPQRKAKQTRGVSVTLWALPFTLKGKERNEIVIMIRK